MTDTNANLPTVPPFLAGIIHDMAQKALTAAATAAVGKGVLDAAQTHNFVEVGVGIALSIASIAWTLAANAIRHSRYKALLNAASPTQP